MCDWQQQLQLMGNRKRPENPKRESRPKYIKFLQMKPNAKFMLKGSSHLPHPQNALEK